MPAECLAKPCSLCGKKITGVNWVCPDCKICVCFMCGIRMSEAEYPVKCPMCRRKLV